MNRLDAIGGIVLGTYLIAVIVKGNGKTLLELAKRDKEFSKFAIALIVLIWLYSIKEIRPIVGMFIGMTFVSLFINKLGPISENAKKFWSGLNSK